MYFSYAKRRVSIFYTRLDECFIHLLICFEIYFLLYVEKNKNIRTLHESENYFCI
jgi:hypothetical protein